MKIIRYWFKISSSRRKPQTCRSDFATGRWFSPVSSSYKFDRHNVTEILLKVALYTITLTMSLHFILVVAVCCLVCVSPRIMAIFTFGINYCYGWFTRTLQLREKKKTTIRIVATEFVYIIITMSYDFP